MSSIRVGRHIATKQKNGTFLYKVDTDVPLGVKKLKTRESDKPHFPVVEKVERGMKQKSKDMFQTINYDIVNFLKTL